MSESDSSAIHPSLRLPIFRIAIAEDPTPTTYNALKNEYLTTTSIDGREICLQAMGRVQSASLATDFLNFQFSDKVAVQDLHTGSIALAANSKTRDVFWEWVQSHWAAVLGKMTGRMVVMDRFLKNTLGKFASFERAEEVSTLFRAFPVLLPIYNAALELVWRLGALFGCGLQLFTYLSLFSLLFITKGGKTNVEIFNRLRSSSRTRIRVASTGAWYR